MMKLKKTIAMCGIVLAGNVWAQDPLPAVTPAAAGFSDQGMRRIDAFFADQIARQRMPGAVLAIARDGKLAYYKAYGHQDQDAKIAMPKDAIFNLASMTKVMAVVGALTFYEEGKLNLSAPLSDWYPQFSTMQVGQIAADGSVTSVAATRPITIQDLMRHTSGMTYGGRGTTALHKLYPASSADAAIDFDGAGFINKLASLPLLYQPASVWEYGFSVDVLGLVEEKIAGKKLGDILQERVWDKVGMPDTSFAVPAEKRQRLAQALALDPISGKAQTVRVLNAPLKFDCAGSCSFATAGDYVRFGQMLLDGGVIDGQRVLSAQTVALMTSDHLGSSIVNRVSSLETGRAGYGFGLGVAVRKEKGLAASNGSVGDYTWNGANGTIFWVDPQEKLVVVMMSVAPGEIRKIHREQMSALVYGAMTR